MSGRIPAGLGRKDNPKSLADFDGYAEMIVTMLQWARQEEGLRLKFLGPFNETDYGYPEGPQLQVEDLIAATQVLLQKLAAHELADVQLILADDTGPNLSRAEAILQQSSLGLPVSNPACQTGRIMNLPFAIERLRDVLRRQHKSLSTAAS